MQILDAHSAVHAHGASGQYRADLYIDLKCVSEKSLDNENVLQLLPSGGTGCGTGIISMQLT